MKELGKCLYGEICEETCYLRFFIESQSKQGGFAEPTLTKGSGPYWPKDDFISLTEKVMRNARENKCYEIEDLGGNTKKIIKGKSQRGELI